VPPVLGASFQMTWHRSVFATTTSGWSSSFTATAAMIVSGGCRHGWVVLSRILIDAFQAQANAFTAARTIPRRDFQYVHVQLLSQLHHIFHALHKTAVVVAAPQLTNVNQAALAVLKFEIHKGAVTLDARDAALDDRARLQRRRRRIIVVRLVTMCTIVRSSIVVVVGILLAPAGRRPHGGVVTRRLRVSTTAVVRITIRCRTIAVRMMVTTIALSIALSIAATGSTSRILAIVLAALALLGPQELFLVTRFIVVVVRRGASKFVHHLRHAFCCCWWWLLCL